jgi:enoyl-CoA hydratase/carnithine racemase
MSAAPFVLRSTLAKGVVKLTMNRPNSFNALSEGMITSLGREIKEIGAGAGTGGPGGVCRVVVIAGAGRAFCAGHDIKEMVTPRNGSTYTPSEEYYQNLFRSCSELMMSIQALPQPVVAQVQGVAAAAGCQLVSMCDLAVASRTASFAVSGINYGLFCATPAVGLSRSMGRKHTLEMLLTGDSIDAETAALRGLVNRVVDPEDLDEEVLQLAIKIASKPSSSIAIGKKMFYEQIEVGIDDAYNIAASAMTRNMMHPDAQEGFQAFKEKRPPSWSLK